MRSARRILKLWLASLVVFGCGFSLQSQSQFFGPRKILNPAVHGEKCASNTIHEQKILNDPAYAAAFIQAENTVKNHLASQAFNHNPPVYTIPVVVHIIHIGENIGDGTNISDEQVQSAIVALNEDFRKMSGTNGDGSGVDVEMQFCLAIRDPQGNPTNGIVRVDGSSVLNYANEGISIGQGSGADEAAVKQLSHWSPDDYYNIWIVNEIEDNDGGSGIQGFAYFPNGSATDGTVILFNAFGTVGNLKSYTNMNRVTTHEIGHAFSLYHTFQGGTCTESNCNTQGDRVCDTPPTTLNSSCNNPACGGEQQVENYMDYTSQTCQNMFTQGQKDRMRASLESLRPSLLNSLGCVPVTNVDAAMNSINSPSNTLCSSTFEPEISIANYGSQTINTLEISYDVDGESQQNYTWTGALLTAETTVITLPAISTGPGAHTLNVSTNNPNGGTDENGDNNTLSAPFEIIDGETIGLTITLDNYGEDNTWEITDASGNIVAEGGPYANFNLGQENFVDVCLEEGCYDFTIYDAYGDGMCCQFGFGGYEIVLPDGSVALEGGDFEDSETGNFCVSSNPGSQAPISNFSSNQTTICESSSVNFNDESSFVPTSWNWTFEGGSPNSSSEQDPSGITYDIPGTYSVTLEVSNANGSDTETKTAYIVVTDQPNLTGSVEDASCSDSSDGSINLEVENWTPGIDYEWSNGFTGQDPSGLSSGSYTVNIEDNAGCTAMASFTIDSPSALDIDAVQIENVDCNGLSTGSIEVDVEGGIPGYALSWNDSANQTGSVASNLMAGTYHVTVSDANGCERIESFIVNEPSAIIPTKVFSQPDSCDQGIGSAQISVGGGTPGYEIVWNDALSTTGPLLSNVLAGQYTAVITDQNNCTKNASVWIDEIPCGGASVGTSDFSASSTVTCEGNSLDFFDESDFDGSEWNWTFEGGIPETSTEQNPSGILYTSPGTYFVSLEVSTSNGSDAEVKNGYITVTTAPTLNGVITDASCFDSADGSINLQLAGAASGITYEWNNGFIGQDPSNLEAGDYTVELIDGAGCYATGTYTVGSPDDIGIATIFSQADSCDLGIGMIEVAVSGGTPNYAITWNDSENQTGSVLMNVFSGEYEAFIIDANGCEKTVVAYVDDVNCDGTVGIEENLNSQIQVFPNPLEDGNLIIDFGKLVVNSCNLSIIDLSGKQLINSKHRAIEQSLVLNLSELSNGIYLIQLETDQGIFSKRLIKK
ncbi:MAG: M43 family zinc metalloprotease [Bacteroidota bacterium]